MTGEQLKASLLQLAIEGKLVEQDPSEEPAKILLEKIAKEREKILLSTFDNKKEADSQLRKQKNQQVKELYPLPDGWCWCTLLQCSLVVVDCHNKTAPYAPSGINLIRTSNIKNGKITYDKMKFVTVDIKRKWSSRCYPQRNDILITREAPMGEVCILPSDNFCLGQRIMLIRLLEDLMSVKFLYYFLQNVNLLDFIVDQPVGMTVPHIRVGGIETMHIPLPPLAEQGRIVARLEELLPLAEQFGEARARLTRLEKELPEKLKASLLQEAIQGKLVPQLDAEPAVEQIGDAPEDVPFAIPEKWKWVELKSCVVLNPRVTCEDETEVSFIPMASVTAGYTSQINISQSRIWKKVKNGFSKFEDGDVIMAKITPCFQNKKSVIVKNALNGIAAGSTEFHVLRCLSDINPKYLLFFLKSSYFIEFGIDNFKGTAGQQRIGTQDLKKCPIPLPPLAEQGRIVARLEELLQEVEKLN